MKEGVAQIPTVVSSDAGVCDLSGRRSNTIRQLVRSVCFSVLVSFRYNVARILMKDEQVVLRSL